MATLRAEMEQAVELCDSLISVLQRHETSQRLLHSDQAGPERSYLVGLHSTLDKRLRTAASLRNEVLAKIFRLPDEVLSCIFSVPRNEDWDSLPAFAAAVAGVCQSWRRVALASSALWTTIVVGLFNCNQHVIGVQNVLPCVECRADNRACNGSAPCASCTARAITHQCIYLPQSCPQPCRAGPLSASRRASTADQRTEWIRRARSSPITLDVRNDAKPEDVFAVVQHIASNSSPVRRLFCHTGLFDIFRLINHAIPFWARSLETLHLAFEPVAGQPIIAHLGGFQMPMPRLLEVRLTEIPLVDSLPGLANCKAMSVMLRNHNAHPSLVPFLLPCAALEELCMVSTQRDNIATTAGAHIPQAILPALKKLTVEAQHRTFRTWMSQINAPQVETLILSGLTPAHRLGMEDQTLMTNSVVAFLRSSPNVGQLAFWHFLPNPHHMVALLRHSTNLRLLSLNAHGLGADDFRLFFTIMENTLYQTGVPHPCPALETLHFHGNPRVRPLHLPSSFLASRRAHPTVASIHLLVLFNWSPTTDWKEAERLGRLVDVFICNGRRAIVGPLATAT